MLNDNETPTLMVTANEAARILSLSLWKVYELAAAGVIEKRYVGARTFRIPVRSLEMYVDTLPTEPMA